MARDDICRSEGSLMDPERLGHLCGKTQFERAIASSCQLIGRDDTSHANQQVGRDTARHATSKHQSSAAARAAADIRPRTPSRHRHVAPDARGTHRLEKTRRGTNLQDGRNPRRRACPRQSDPGPSNPVRSSRQCYGRTHGRRAHSLPPHRGITGRTQTLTRHIHAGGLKIPHQARATRRGTPCDKGASPPRA